jgi:hypothetical protein
MDDPSPTAPDLSWTTVDLPALERRLARIGIAAPPDHVLRWSSATVRLVETPGADRLRLDGWGRERPATDDADRSEPAKPGVELLAVGWATVELDRAASEFPMAAFEPAADDPLLGAFVWRSRGDGRLVLLEPNTEGPLVASLVRWGEGPAALYLDVPEATARSAHPAPAEPGALSAERIGPLGPSALLLGGPIAGPHMIVVRRRPAGSIDPPAAGTIRA